MPCQKASINLGWVWPLLCLRYFNKSFNEIALVRLLSVEMAGCNQAQGKSTTHCLDESLQCQKSFAEVMFWSQNFENLASQCSQMERDDYEYWRMGTWVKDWDQLIQWLEETNVHWIYCDNKRTLSLCHPVINQAISHPIPVLITPLLMSIWPFQALGVEKYPLCQSIALDKNLDLLPIPGLHFVLFNFIAKSHLTSSIEFVIIKWHYPSILNILFSPTNGLSCQFLATKAPDLWHFIKVLCCCHGIGMGCPVDPLCWQRSEASHEARKLSPVQSWPGSSGPRMRQMVSSLSPPALAPAMVSRSLLLRARK